MPPPPTSHGISCWPDGYDPNDQPRGPLPWWLRALLFLLFFGVLQFLYNMAANTWVQRLFVETLGSHPAALLINIITPDLHAEAKASRVFAPGGGINILGGCEGTEVLFLLLAGFLSISMPWRRRLTGITLGMLLVFLLNQVRIVSLFYASRVDRELFDLIHTVAAPIIFIALIALYFYAWIDRDRRLATTA